MTSQKNLLKNRLVSIACIYCTLIQPCWKKLCFKLSYSFNAVGEAAQWLPVQYPCTLACWNVSVLAVIVFTVTMVMNAVGLGHVWTKAETNQPKLQSSSLSKRIITDSEKRLSHDYEGQLVHGSHSCLCTHADVILDWRRPGVCMLHAASVLY